MASQDKQLKKFDWIADLHNEGGYEVYTKNYDDDSNSWEWLAIGIGIVACYTLGEILIAKYRKRKELN